MATYETAERVSVRTFAKLTEQTDRPPADGLMAELLTPVVTAPLHARVLQPAWERVQTHWHSTESLPGTEIVLQTQPGEEARTIELAVESPSPAFRPEWVNWSFRSHALPPGEGDDSLRAALLRDHISDEGRRLRLVLPPGHPRTATLSFRLTLDGQTPTGNFPFYVVVRSVGGEDRTLARRAGLLAIRHPKSQLLHQLPRLWREALAELPPRPEPASNADFLPERNGHTEHGPEGNGHASKTLTPEALNRLLSGEYVPPPFFTRYLLGIEDLTGEFQEALGGLFRCFGPGTAPPDFLPWLATWLGLALDENWPELRRRALIREAVSLYRRRGTKRGLRRYLYLYAGVTPEIRDQAFEGMVVGSQAVLGRRETVLGGLPPHTFSVTLRVSNPALVRRSIVSGIIEAQKPAHTAYLLYIVRQGEKDPRP